MTVEFYVKQGIVQANQGDLQQAIASFRCAIELRSDPDVYYNLGVLQAMAGRSDEATISFRCAIALRPDFFEAYNNLGAILKDGDHLDEAEACFLRAIELYPEFPEAYNNLGLTQAKANRLDEAEECYRRAIELRPDYSEAFNNQGLMHVLSHCLGDAETSLRRAVELNPAYPEAYNNLGTVLRDGDHLEEAEACLRRAIELRPNYPDAYYNLGLTQAKANRPADAVESYCRTIELRPNYPEAYNNLGVVLKGEGHTSEAVDCFRSAIELAPEFPEAYNNLGAVSLDRESLDEAEKNLRRAIDLRPDYPEAFNNLGTALRNMDRLAEAEDCFRRAIEVTPGFPEAYHNLGLVLMDKGSLNEAEACLERAIELRPDFPDAEYAFSTLYLLQENYDKGWEKFESRTKVFRNYHPEIRRWQGEDLTGQKILLFCEQGFGDTIQFMRYAPKVAELAAETTVWVQKPLTRLLADTSSVFAVYAGDTIPPGEYNFSCPLLSLPMMIDNAEKPIPRNVPYIRPSGEISDKWRAFLASRDGGEAYRVGVVWAGNPKHKNNRNRSIAFETFATLFNNDSVSWISLQVGSEAEKLAGKPYRVADFSNKLVDFSETAGLIDNLDLVIVVDTAVAHLAGAMGKTTWLLVPFTPDWRWQLCREDSPWYPTMRVFRQRRIGDWPEVIERVKAALDQEVRTVRQSGAVTHKKWPAVADGLKNTGAEV